jgi:hypothetical protein
MYAYYTLRSKTTSLKKSSFINEFLLSAFNHIISRFKIRYLLNISSEADLRRQIYNKRLKTIEP